MPRGEYVEITWEDTMAIRKLYKEGRGGSSISKKLSLPMSGVYRELHKAGLISAYSSAKHSELALKRGQKGGSKEEETAIPISEGTDESPGTALQELVSAVDNLGEVVSRIVVKLKEKDTAEN